MEKVFIYWDNSNILHGAQYACEEIENEGAKAYWRLQIDLKNLWRLAHADRPIEKVTTVGSESEMRILRNRMSNENINMEFSNIDTPKQGEKESLDQFLQLKMLEHALDYYKDPGIVVLLTGDGKGYEMDTGFHSTLKRMHDRKWQIEVLSWQYACNKNMKEWAKENGIFIALDDFYRAITFLKPWRPNEEPAPARNANELDLPLR